MIRCQFVHGALTNAPRKFGVRKVAAIEYFGFEWKHVFMKESCVKDGSEKPAAVMAIVRWCEDL